LWQPCPAQAQLHRDHEPGLGETGCQSEIGLEAQHRQLRISQFGSLRQWMIPFANALGFLTDKDVFDRVS
jgi:hypothetical protein